MLFVVNNNNLFHVNSEIHSINTRKNSNLYEPQANLTLYQKGAHYSGIKVFNSLHPNIKNLSWDVKRFKLELGKYLHLKTFYTPEEYFNSYGKDVYKPVSRFNHL
jgi:thiamine pyrophosphokinase